MSNGVTSDYPRAAGVIELAANRFSRDICQVAQGPSAMIHGRKQTGKCCWSLKSVWRVWFTMEVVVRDVSDSETSIGDGIAGTWKASRRRQKAVGKVPLSAMCQWLTW